MKGGLVSASFFSANRKVKVSSSFAAYKRRRGDVTRFAESTSVRFGA